MEIEIFRTGTFTDSAGYKRTYTNDDLQRIADNYNSRLAADASVIAPIVKGHPADNSPALGWTAYIKHAGDRLIAGIKSVDTEFMEELQQGKYKKVSISLYPDLMLRHIGFLGAAAPAVSGLEPAEFIEYYSQNTKTAATDSTATDAANYSKQITQLQTEIEAYKNDLAQYREAERLSEYKAYCSKAVNASDNAPLNSIINECVPELMNLAFNYDSQNNSADYNLNLVKNFLNKLAKLPVLSNLSGISDMKSDFMLPSSYSFSGVNANRAAKHRKAMEIITSKPEITYEQALDLV